MAHTRIAISYLEFFSEASKIGKNAWFQCIFVTIKISSYLSMYISGQKDSTCVLYQISKQSMQLVYFWHLRIKVIFIVGRIKWKNFEKLYLGNEKSYDDKSNSVLQTKNGTRWSDEERHRKKWLYLISRRKYRENGLFRNF